MPGLAGSSTSDGWSRTRRFRWGHLLSAETLGAKLTLFLRAVAGASAPGQ